MKKLYSFLLTAIIAAVAAFQANAYTLTMNVTGADLLEFLWYYGDTEFQPEIPTDGDYTFTTDQFDPTKTSFSIKITPKKPNVNLTVTSTDKSTAEAYIDPVGKNGKTVWAYGGDVDLIIVAEEYEAVFCPIHFQFANEGTDDYIKYIFVDDGIENNFMAEDFAVMAGTKIYFAFNTDKYAHDADADGNWCYRNGEAYNNPPTGSWTSEPINEETTYVFRVKPNPVYDVNFKVNNPNTAEVSIGSGVSELLTENENIKQVVVKPDDGSTRITVRPSGDYGIKSVTRIVDGEDPVEENISYGYCTLYFYEKYGNCTYEITTMTKEELRTASCTVNIDANPENVKITRNYVEITDLVEGNNTIKFNPNDYQESYLNISTRDYTPLYQVLVDGEKQSSQGSGSSYSVNIKDNCTVQIKTVMPDTPAHLSFEFTKEGTEAFIKSIDVDNEPVDLTGFDFANGLDVKRGAYVYMKFDTEAFDPKALYVDGQQAYSTYSWSGTVLDDKVFKFDVDTYPVINATINVNKPQFVSLKVNATYGDDYPLQPGENPYSYMGSSAPEFIIKPKEGGEITSVKVNGEEIQLSMYGYYSIRVEDGMNIEIEADGPERDLTAMFWSDVTSYDGDLYTLYLCTANNDLGYSFYPIDLYTNYNAGYQQFAFRNEENPFRIGCNGWGFDDPKIYLNNEEVNLGELGYVMELAQGDVVKCFVYNAAPAKYDITFDVPAEAADAIAVTTDRIRKEATYTSGINVLQGTEITIAPTDEAAPISGVSVDGTAIDPAADGSYTFTASAAHAVKINAQSSILSVGSDNAPAKVYNLQGIRVASDLNALPAGIYIINGVKTYVK